MSSPATGTRSATAEISARGCANTPSPLRRWQESLQGHLGAAAVDADLARGGHAGGDEVLAELWAIAASSWLATSSARRRASPRSWVT